MAKLPPPPLDASMLKLPEINGQWNRIVENTRPVTAADISAQVARRLYSPATDSPPSAVNNVTNNNVQPGSITLINNITTQPGADGEDIATAIEKKFDADFRERLRQEMYYNMKETK